MSKLIVQATDTAEWYVLVNEAQARRALTLGTDLESYLIFLLNRFAARPEIIETIFGIEYLKAEQTIGQERSEVMRELGDKCLLYSGLFPENAEQRLVGLNYYVGIGQTAYGAVAEVEQINAAQLYAELCDRFTCVMHVMHAMRDVADETDPNIADWFSSIDKMTKLPH